MQIGAIFYSDALKTFDKLKNFTLTETTLNAVKGKFQKSAIKISFNECIVTYKDVLLDWRII